MSADRFHDLSVEQQEKIDAICTAFEERWQGGQSPAVDEFLERGADLDEDALLFQLLLSDLEQRSRHDSAPAAAQFQEAYLARVKPELRPPLLQAFLRNDLRRQRESGKAMTVDDYLSLFGEYESLIRKEIEACLEPNSELTRTASLDAAANGRRVGPYRLLRRIGAGGMGEVWEAEQIEVVRRRVAVKLIKTGMDSKQIIRRFELERQALAMMDHPNIAKVLDGGTTAEGVPYFAMELVKGVPITQFCDERRLTIEERLRLFGSVCNAVEHAHQNGVVHRDIKPSNVLVAELHEEVVVKVIDFGLAKAIHPTLTEKTELTQFGQIVGTLEYMSPEQSEMGPQGVDARTDVYALGVLMYELLAGSTPLDRRNWQARALDEIVRSIREETPMKPSARLRNTGQDSDSSVSEMRGTDLRSLSSAVAGDLDCIVMKAIEKDRNRRFPSVAALSLDVKCYLRGDPIRSRPPSVMYRLRKAVTRHRRIAAVSAIVCASLAIALVAVIWSKSATTASAEKLKLLEGEKQVERLLAESSRLRQHYEPGDARALLPLVEALEFAEKFDAAAAESIRSQIATGIGQLEFQPLAQLRLVGRVACVDFSRDGQHGVACSRSEGGGQVVAWNTQAGSENFPTLSFDHPVHDAAFHPRRNSFACVTAAFAATRSSGEVQVRSAVDGAPAWPAVTIPCALLTLKFSPDGRLLACGGAVRTARNEKGMVVILDADSGKVVHKHETDSRVTAVAFSADGRKLAAAARPSLFVLNSETGETLFDAFPCPEGAPEWVSESDHLAFTEDDQLVAGAERFGVAVWGLSTAKPELLGWSAAPQENELHHVAVAPDRRHILLLGPTGSRITLPDCEQTEIYENAPGKSVASAAVMGNNRVALASEGAVVLRSTSSGRQVGGVIIHGEASVTAVAYSRESAQLATGGDEGRICLWTRVRSGRLLCDVAEISNRGGILSRDGRRFAGVDSQGRLRVIDFDSNEVAVSDKLDWNAYVEAAFSPDGRFVVVSGDRERESGPLRGVSHVYRVIPGNASLVAKLEDEAGCQDAAFSPDGKLLAITSGRSTRPGGGLTLVRTSDWKTLFRHQEPVGMLVTEFSPDSKTVFASTLEGEMIALDTASGKLLGRMHEEDRKRFPFAVFRIHVRRNFLAAAMNGSPIAAYWNLKEFKQTGRFVHDANVIDVKLDDEARYVATAASDKTARIWSRESGEAVSAAMLHEGRVSNVTFSPDGRRLATVCLDGAARVWSVPSGEPLTATLHHDDPIIRAIFQNDGSELVTHTWNKELGRATVRAWQLGSPSEPVARLRERLELLTQHRYDVESGVTRLSPDEVHRRWSALRKR